MKINYDPEADAMYIKLKNTEVDTTLELDENVIIDLDKQGNIRSIEILFVKERNPEILKAFKIDNLLTA